MKKRRSIVKSLEPFLLIFLLLFVWELICILFRIPIYLLPKPSQVFKELFEQFYLLMQHSIITLIESIAGLIIAMLFGVLIAVIMNAFKPLGRMLYPILVISQAVPIIAIAPLILIWFGLGIGPKIGIVTIVCFFPIAVSSFEGFKLIDTDAIDIMRTLNATKFQIYRHVVLPSTLPYIFSGLKIAASYCVLGAVVGEWLGADKGLGVYMVRAMGAFRTDRLFVAILLTVFFSIIIFKVVDILSEVLLPWVKLKQVQGG
ncbi:MAG: hypothetical protein PWQ48_245 [Thermotogaceae bacterium]|nr:hypothetical protein [Thermotogaceae bacterium]